VKRTSRADCGRGRPVDLALHALREVTSEEKMADWVRDILSRKAAGTDQPFAVIQLASGKVAGATRYMEIRPAHLGLEIGGTWYGKNSSAHRLIPRRSICCCGMPLKCWDVSACNSRLTRAMSVHKGPSKRIGAVREGVLRNHMILEGGLYRHSVFYSILDSEWPA